MERTLKGIMADAGVDQAALADVLHVSRSTMNRKIQTDSFTLKEVRKMIDFFHIVDPILAYDIFLRPSSQ